MKDSNVNGYLPRCFGPLGESLASQNPTSSGRRVDPSAEYRFVAARRSQHTRRKRREMVQRRKNFHAYLWLTRLAQALGDAERAYLT
jgi:hypothetical protein